jgi:hypothetical protein
VEIKRTCSSSERDRAIVLAVVGERVDVVVGGDALRVAEQLSDLCERAGALVEERAATTSQPVRREVRRAGQLACLRDRRAQPRIGQLAEERRL